MEISHNEITPGTVVVTIAGKIMRGPESEQIVSLVDDLVRKGNKKFVFDLAGVSRIDSTGIGRFIASYNSVAPLGGEIRMAAATGHLLQAFHVSMLDTVFPFYPSVEAALA